jgi:CheY-like chemotaxis protein
MFTPSSHSPLRGRLRRSDDDGHALAQVTTNPEGADRGRDESVRVLVVDDHEVFRDALRELVAAVPRFVVVGQACSGEEAVGVAERLSPQLVLMDVRMPGMDGVAAARVILSRHPRVVVVLISADDAVSYIRRDDLGQSVAWARKQDLRPEKLSDVWETLHH